MSHPQVAEAVAFGCPDEKYGEIVAAAVVPNKPVQDTAAFAKDIQKQAGQKMAAFKVSLPCLVCCEIVHAEHALQSNKRTSKLPCLLLEVQREHSMKQD